MSIESKGSPRGERCTSVALPPTSTRTSTAILPPTPPTVRTGSEYLSILALHQALSLMVPSAPALVTTWIFLPSSDTGFRGCTYATDPSERMSNVEHRAPKLLCLVVVVILPCW